MGYIIKKLIIFIYEDLASFIKLCINCYASLKQKYRYMHGILIIVYYNSISNISACQYSFTLTAMHPQMLSTLKNIFKCNNIYSNTKHCRQALIVLIGITQVSLIPSFTILIIYHAFNMIPTQHHNPHFRGTLYCSLLP